MNDQCRKNAEEISKFLELYGGENVSGTVPTGTDYQIMMPLPYIEEDKHQVNPECLAIICSRDIEHRLKYRIVIACFCILITCSLFLYTVYCYM